MPIDPLGALLESRNWTTVTQYRRPKKAVAGKIPQLELTELPRFDFLFAPVGTDPKKFDLRHMIDKRVVELSGKR